MSLKPTDQGQTFSCASEPVQRIAIAGTQRPDELEERSSKTAFVCRNPGQ